MQLPELLRDGMLGDEARLRHLSTPAQPSELDEGDPSGRHDFGHRAHQPDPNARYGFEPDQRPRR